MVQTHIARHSTMPCGHGSFFRSKRANRFWGFVCGVVQEYLDASRGRRLAYRVMRNPVVLFVIGPLVQLIGVERVPTGQDT